MALSVKMKEKMFGPNESLFRRGEYDNKVYFIRKGAVDLLLERRNYDVTKPHFYLKRL